MLSGIILVVKSILKNCRIVFETCHFYKSQWGDWGELERRFSVDVACLIISAQREADRVSIETGCYDCYCFIFSTRFLAFRRR